MVSGSFFNTFAFGTTLSCNSHMFEIVGGRLSNDANDWKILLENNCSDKEMLKTLIERGGWTAAVDFPASLCWEQLLEIYPNAKVIHTERTSPEKWWESASNTIMIVGNKPVMKLAKKVLPFLRIHKKMMDALFGFITKKRVGLSDPGWPSIYKNEFTEAYSSNNARVRQVVPNDRLLVHEHGNGWMLLAKFLNKDVPNKPYPHKNTRSDFMNRIRNATFCVVIVAAALVMVVYRSAKREMDEIFIVSKKNKSQ